MGKAKTRTPLGDWIRSGRDKKGWSQARLSLRMRTSPHVTLISRWESGDHQPSARHLAELARVFDERPPVKSAPADEDESDSVAAAMQAIDALLYERAIVAFRRAREMEMSA